MKKRLSLFLSVLVVFFIGALVYFYINPGPKVVQSEASEWLRTTPIAHRGLHSNDLVVPENSMSAFSKAIKFKYGIELDVQLTADGKVVVFHDYHLLRMTGLDKNVHELTWEELKKLRLLQSDQGIPLLSDVLALIDGQTPLLIEIKNEGDIGELEQKTIDLVANYKGEFAIMSFNPYSIQYVKDHAPDILRGQLSGSFKEEGDLAYYKKFVLKYLLLNGKSAPHFVAYEFDEMPQWLINRQKAKNVYLLTWSIRSEEEAKKAKGRFDNIIFELFFP